MDLLNLRKNKIFFMLIKMLIKKDLMEEELLLTLKKEELISHGDLEG
jgi:hypothetical protein